MDRKWYAPQALACEMPEALAYEMTELEIDKVEFSKDELAALEKEATQEKEASTKMAAGTAREADLPNIHTGPRTARAEVVHIIQLAHMSCR